MLIKFKLIRFVQSYPPRVDKLLGFVFSGLEICYSVSWSVGWWIGGWVGYYYLLFIHVLTYSFYFFT